MESLLTVLMAVHNGARFLRVSMESILGQTYRNFRFLIVDDASTDETVSVVHSYPDPRIELVHLPHNVGQTAALNVGLRHASTPWVARMDADDYSAPIRLEKQMHALEEVPSLSCIGTGVWEFREDPAVVEVVKMRPAQHSQIRRAALHGSGMIHGAIVVNRQALLQIGAYDERYRYASDRDLFLRLLNRYRAMNLQEPLLGIRRHPAQDSFSERAADEYIDIFARLLSADGLSAEDRAIVRGSLAYSHLFRASCHWRGRQYDSWWRDQLSAFRISSRSCFRSWLGSCGLSLLPGQIRGKLRKDFVSSIA